MKFRHINVENGLSSNTVWSVVQDDDGYMWFGTNDGLNKYDGYNFTIYRNQQGDTLSLANSRIIDLLVDKDGRLWVGTADGLHCYLKDKNTFIRFDPPAFQFNFIRSLVLDYHGRLWIGTTEGLYQLDTDTGTYVKSGSIADKPYSFLDMNIMNVIEDNNRNLWICTKEGLYVLKNGIVSRASVLATHPIFSSNKQFRDVHQDSKGQYWIATESIENGNTYLKNLPKTQEIEVYSNLEKVELFQNGKSLGFQRKNENEKLIWNVNFVEGENRILAKGKKGKVVIEDFLLIHFNTHSINLQPGDQLSINMGFNAEFVDDNNMIWLPDQEYIKDTYGYKNGKSYMANKDLIVTNTKRQPILYNYSLEGVDHYKLDVPDGDYLVELHFAETQYHETEMRIFNVTVNGIRVFDQLDMVLQYGFLKAFNKSIGVAAKGSNGVEINFEAIKGNPSISALHIKRLN